jgi:excisionase family DNA binding protein
MEKLLMRPTEAANALGLGRSKIYELIANRAIPSVRIGRSVRVPIEELRQWISNQQRENRGEDFREPLKEKKEK